MHDSQKRAIRGGAQNGAGFGVAALIAELAGWDLSALAFGGLVWLCGLLAGAVHVVLEDRGVVRSTR